MRGPLNISDLSRRSTQPLAIVGASVRAAAMSALRAGLAPVAVDLFADADLRALCPAERVTSYPRGLAEWLADAPAGAWLYTGGLENHPVLVASMARPGIWSRYQLESSRTLRMPALDTFRLCQVRSRLNCSTSKYSRS